MALWFYGFMGCWFYGCMVVRLYGFLFSVFSVSYFLDAFHVDDIHQELERLTKEGFQQIGEVKEGADNKLICFLHPKTTNGVLIELCQEKLS